MKAAALDLNTESAVLTMNEGKTLDAEKVRAALKTIKGKPLDVGSFEKLTTKEE